MAKYINDNKEGLYAISSFTGATRNDGWIDIEGGIGTFFAYASRGRREFPNETFHVEGPQESLSKGGMVDSKRIFAMGRSAGGLLMGAIANMRPDLFKGIVAKPDRSLMNVTFRTPSPELDAKFVKEAEAAGFSASLRAAAVPSRAEYLKTNRLL